MGHTITPSPTPPNDDPSSLTVFASALNGVESESAQRLHNLGWGYGTPPLEEGGFCEQETFFTTSREASLFSDLDGFPDHSNQASLSSDMSNHRVTRASVATNQSSSHYQGGRDDSEWDETPSRRPRRKAAGRGSRKDKKLQYPDLLEPLSAWAKDNGVQPKDVHAFATRDIKKRLAQVSKTGHIKRNLNVFFLYKRSYGNVAQAWMEIHHPAQAKTQPPLVTLVGESWSKESAEFKRSYAKYSELEKEGLRKAFPHYKYKPGSKNRPTGAASIARAPSATPEQETPGHRRQFAPSGSSVHHQGFYDYPPITDLYQSPGSVREEADAGFRMNNAPGVGLQPFVEPREFSYPPRSWSGSPAQGPTISTYGNKLLHPGQNVWPSAFGRRISRSASPSFHHYARQRGKFIPIDPSLPDSSSEFPPSRALSEEPGYIVPSQTFTAGPPQIVYSRAASSEPFMGGSNDFHQMTPAMHPPRFTSVEPWQATDSVLSSVPAGSDFRNSMPASESYDWHLEPLEQDEQNQQIPFDLNDWTHDLDGDDLDGA